MCPLRNAEASWDEHSFYHKTSLSFGSVTFAHQPNCGSQLNTSDSSEWRTWYSPQAFAEIMTNIAVENAGHGAMICGGNLNNLNLNVSVEKNKRKKSKKRLISSVWIFRELCYLLVWYGLIMHFCDSNHEIARSSKRKYNNIKDH